MAPKSARVKDRKTFRPGRGLWRGAVPCVSARMCRVLRAENFCARQAGGCAVPDPGRFGEPDIRPCPHTHVVAPQPNTGDQTWLTTPQTPTRPSSFSD